MTDYNFDVTVPSVDADHMFIDSIASLPSRLLDMYQYIVDMIQSVFSALSEFYQMLNDFDARIVDMAESTGQSELAGYPVVEAIGTFRFLVGDVVFYMIYMVVLFGCLFTIYKIVILLFDAVDSIIEEVTGVNCKTLLGNLLSKLFG